MGFENLKLIVVTETFISVDVLKDVTNTISSNVYFTKQKYSYFECKTLVTNNKRSNVFFLCTCNIKCNLCKWKLKVVIRDL